MEYKRPFTALQLLVATTCLVLGVSVQAAQEFYKWKDKDGVTHYSATPPKTESTETVRTTNLDPGETEAADGGDEATSGSDEPGSNDKQASASPKPPAKNAAECEKARKNLETLETTPRIRMPDGDGFRYLTPAEIEEQKSLNRQAIDVDC